MANNKFSNEAVDALFARVTQQQTADYNPVQEATTVANTQRNTAATNARNTQVARETDHTISTDMLESNNPFVWAGANAWNTSNRAWATVAHAGTAISGGMVNTRARSLERSVPADVKAAHTRIQVVRNSKQRIVDNINAIEAGVAKGQIDPVQAQLDIQKLVAENAQLSINPADFEKINSTVSGGVERFGYATFNDVLEHAAQLRSEAGKMVGDRSKGIDDAIGSGSWWNQTANKRMMSDIQTSNAELLSANPGMGTFETIGKLTANTARVATDSPKEIVGMAAESLLSAFSKPAIALTTVGDTADFLITQRNRFNEKGDRQGTAMTSGENLQTDAAGVAFGALNFIGDMALNRALQTVSSAKAVIADTAASTATNASKSLLARVAESNAANVVGNVVNNPITRNAGRMGAAMGQEYVTEGLQSVLEDSYGHMDNGFNTQAFAEGGTLGALAAGVMTAPSTAARTANDIAGITRKSATVEQQLDINDARNFNPVNAMAQSYRDAEQSPDGIQAARDTNKAILTDLTSQLDTLLEEQRVWNQRTPQMEKLKADLKDAGLDLASAQMVGTDDEVAAIQEKMDSLATTLVQLESMEDGDRSSTIKHIRSEITKASNYHTKVTSKIDGYDANNLKSIQASQAIIEQPSVSNEDMMKAISDIVSFPMMASPKQLQLAANALATTDPTTADKLRQLSQFKASQTKNTIAETSGDVADGSVTWRGMTGYADEYDLAYATQDTNRIAVLNRELESFQNSMDSKAKVAQELLEESKNNNKAEYTMVATHRPDGMGLEWRVKAPDEKVPDRNFQLKIQKGESDGLVYAIGNDAWLIGKQRELQQQNQAAMADTPVNEPIQPTTAPSSVEPTVEPELPVNAPTVGSEPILEGVSPELHNAQPVEAVTQENGNKFNEDALHAAIVSVLGTDHNPQYIQDTVDYVLGRELAGKDISVSGIQRTAHLGNVKAKAVKEAVETQGKNPTVAPVEVEPTITPPPVPVMNGWDEVYTPAVEPQTAPQAIVDETPVEKPVEDVTPVVDEQSVAADPIDDEAASWAGFTDPTEDDGYYDNEYTEYADTTVDDAPVNESDTVQRTKSVDGKPAQEAVELPPDTMLYRIKNGMDIIPFTATVDNESANEFGGTTYVVTRVNLDGSLGKPLVVESKADQTFFEAVAEALGRPDLATYITEMKTVTHSNELADAHETEYMSSYYFDEDTTYDELVTDLAESVDLLNPKADGAIEVLFDKDRLGSKALVQVVKKGGVNPLQAVKNFLYSMFNQSETLSDLSFNEILNMYVHGAVTSEDSQAMTKFYSFMYERGAYNNQITADLIDKVIKDLELDSLSFVASYIFSKDADGNTVADENVKTAIGVGIFNWVGANLSNTYADNKSVGRLLDAGKDIDVHGVAAKPYRRFYGNRNMMINSVGQDIAKALGLKAAKGEDATRQGQLETSLGMIAYRVMVSRGLVNEETTSYWAVFKDLAKLNRRDVVANYLKKYLTPLDSGYKPHEVLAAFKKFQAIAPFVTVKTGSSSIQLNKLNRYVPYNESTFTVNQQAMNDPDNWYASKILHELPDIMTVLQDAMTLGSGSITFVGNTLSNEVYKAQKSKRVLVGDDALSPATRATFGKLTGYNDILSRLFGVKAYHANPLLKATPFEQSSIKGTLGKVPDALAKALDKIQQLPVVVKPFASTLLGIAEMEDKTLLNAVLGIDESLLADAHVSRVDSIRATNLATERDFTNAQVFLNSIRAEDGTYPHIFHKLVVWSNHRIGIASTTFNFQASKIARAMSTYAQSAVEIVRGDDSIFVDGRKLTHYGALLHGVAVYAEGVTKSADYGDRNMKGMATVDKGKNKYILQAMHEFTTQEDFKQAAAAILKLQASKPLDDIDIRSISAVVARMDGGIQSFEALVELVTFLNLEKGEKFTSYLTVESDGITNGIAINQIQNGTATIEMLQQFGIIPMGNDAEDFFSLKENGLTDYYETVGSTSADTLKTVIKNLDLKDDSDLTNQHITDAIKSLDPDFGGRAGGKKAGTPDNYGAGASRLAEAAALDGYASIIKEIEKAKRTQNADRLLEINVHIDNIRQLFNKRFAQIDTNSNSTVLYEQMLWEVKNELRSSPKKEAEVLLKQLESMPVNTESVTMAMTYVFNTHKLIKARAKAIPTTRADIIKFLRIYHDVRNFSKDPVINFNGETQVITLNNALTLNYESTPLHAAILKVFSSVQGGATVQALQKINGEFYTVRTANIALTTQAYKLYDVLYTAAVRNAIDIKIRKGLVQVKPNEHGVLVAEEYLTRQDIVNIERSINKYLPTGDTYYSGQSKNRTSSGIVFIDTADTIVKGERFDQVAALPDPRNPSARVPTVKLGIKQPITAPISLAGNSSVTQSIDAATSIHSTIANIDNGISALNFHDSNGFNILNVQDGATAQNKAFLDVLMNFSTQDSFLTALLRPLQGLNTLNEIILTHEDLSTIEAIMADSAVFFPVMQQAEQNKLALLSQMKVINQYGTENGTYVIDEATRSKIDKAYTAIQNESDKVSKTINLLMGTYNKVAVKKPTKLFAYNKIDFTTGVVNTAKDTDSDTEVDETVPNPINDLITDLGSNNIKGNDLVDGLLGILSNDTDGVGRTKLDGHYASVLALIKYVIDPSITVNLFTRNNIPAHVTDASNVRNKAVKGWYSAKSGQINIMYDPEMSSELIVHELLHAVVSSTIRAAFQRKKQDGTALPIGVASMLYIFTHLKKEIGVGSKVAPQFAEAMSNLDEFISYALSNEEFMVYLHTIKMPKRFTAYTQDKDDDKSSMRLISRLMENVSNTYDAVVQAVHRILGGDKLNAHNKELTALEAVLRAGVRLVSDIDPADYSNKDQRVFNSLGQPSTQIDLTVTETIEKLKSSPNRSDKFNKQFTQEVLPLVQKFFDVVDGSTLVDEIIKEADVQAYWDAAIAANRTPYSSSIRNVGIPMDDQEMLAVEALEAVLNNVIDKEFNSPIYRTIEALYKTARTKLSPADFYDGDYSQATQMDTFFAERQYNAVFGAGSSFDTNGRNHYLTRFMALAVGSEFISSKLAQVVHTPKKTVDNLTVFQSVQQFIENTVNTITEKLARTGTNKDVRSKMLKLIQQLKDIEYKSKKNIFADMYDMTVGSTGGVFNTATGGVRTAIQDVIHSEGIVKSPFAVVRFVGSLSRTLTSKHLFDIGSEMIEIQNRENPGAVLSEINQIANEFATPRGIIKTMRAILAKNNAIQQQRERLMEATKRNLNYLFEADGIDTTQENMTAVTNVLLRTGLSVLVQDGLTLSEIRDFIMNDSSRTAEIKSIEAAVVAGQVRGDVMVQRTLDLAAYSVHNKDSLLLAKNTTIIASEIGFNNKRTLLASDDALVKQLNTLHALYALGMVKPSERILVQQMVVKGKAQDNAVDAVLRLHNDMTQVAKRDLFKNNEMSMAQTYIPEITNTNRDIQMSSSKEQDKYLEQNGYSYVSTLGRGYGLSGSPVKMYYNSESNGQRYVDAAMSITNPSRKGTQAKVASPRKYEQTSWAVKIAQVAQVKGTVDPMLNKDVFVIPSYDTENNVIAYSYEMHGKTRDEVLERNNNVIDVLALYTGSNLEKVNTKAVNITVADALYEDWDTNYMTDPKAFVRISPNESDKKLVEIYRMIPKETRDYMINKFGGNELYVRNAVMNSTFGYRKYAMTEIFDKEAGQRNTFELGYVSVMEGLFGGNARTYTAVGQRAIMEIVAKVKDAIIIRNLYTLVANVVSNFTLLSMYGVNPVASAKYTKVAVSAGLRYKKDLVLLLQAKQQLAMGVGNALELNRTIRMYQDAIDRNPLKEFIDAGMMSAIVEDVSLQTDKYSLESKFTQKYAGLIDVIPQPIQTGFNWMMISPQTPIHAFLANTTALSDFAAKYTLYMHNTAKGMSKEEALFESNEAFINYDVPTSKAVQFANDMGIFMFTKYYYRIQRVIVKLMHERPAAMLVHAIVVGAMLDLPTVFDSFAPNSLGIPLHPSLFMFPAVVTEPLPMSLIFS